jgi:hypothetical protein
MEARMDDAPFVLHLDSDYLWRWYITNIAGNMIAVAGPYFHEEEARKALKVLAMPMAA